VQSELAEQIMELERSDPYLDGIVDRRIEVEYA
jgi:hypothetical protein